MPQEERIKENKVKIVLARYILKSKFLKKKWLNIKSGKFCIRKFDKNIHSEGAFKIKINDNFSWHNHLWINTPACLSYNPIKYTVRDLLELNDLATV